MYTLLQKPCAVVLCTPSVVAQIRNMQHKLPVKVCLLQANAVSVAEIASLLFGVSARFPSIIQQMP